MTGNLWMCMRGPGSVLSIGQNDYVDLRPQLAFFREWDFSWRLLCVCLVVIPYCYL